MSGEPDGAGGQAAVALGIHHVTAICGEPQRNLDFYAGLLGLRFVKRTVNFDDPETYHFYYGDGAGRPGSILTFFPWPGAPRGRVGPGQAAVIAFAIVPEATGFWVERLVHHGLRFEGPSRRPVGADEFEQVLSFRDHDGLMLELVGSPGARGRRGWGGAPGIPEEHALRGFHSVTLWVEQADPTARVLTDTLGFAAAERVAGARRHTVGDRGPGTLVDLRAVGGFPRGVGGVGTVHHVAWRVADDARQLALRERAVAAALDPTPVIDRRYFHSVYFREPGGVLFELATDPPGFTVDEPLGHLGERLMLPPQFETHRPEIEAALPPIHLPASGAEADLLGGAGGPEDVSGEALGLVHRYLLPVAGAELAGSTTLLLLHGTGGDENDLVPLGRSLLPGAGLLSPRGPVLERGMPRFFRRLSTGVFDLEDLVARTAELAGFVEGATRTYGLARDGIVAVGFSNGANIAVSLLLRFPGLLRGAVLLSPMLPYEAEPPGDLTGTAVFIGAGRSDPTAPAAQVERLAAILRQAGAEVSVHWEAGGHALADDELRAARDWLIRSVVERPLVGGE